MRKGPPVLHVERLHCGTDSGEAKRVYVERVSDGDTREMKTRELRAGGTGGVVYATAVAVQVARYEYHAMDVECVDGG